MAMFIPPPLVAIDLEDIIKVVFFLIIGAFWLVKQLMGQEAAKPKRPAPPQVPPPVRPAAGQGPLQDEVSDFLRQARSEKGIHKKRTPKLCIPAPAEPRKSAGKKPPKAATWPRFKERHDVDEHVRDRLDTSKFSDRAEQLGDLVETSNQEFQEHVQEKFSHDLGRLSQSGAGEMATTADAVAASSAGSSAAAVGVSPAAAIAELLRRRIRAPGNHLQEILTPPHLVSDSSLGRRGNARELLKHFSAEKISPFSLTPRRGRCTIT